MLTRATECVTHVVGTHWYLSLTSPLERLGAVNGNEKTRKHTSNCPFVISHKVAAKQVEIAHNAKMYTERVMLLIKMLKH